MRSRRALSTVVGAVFAIIALTSTVTYVSYSMGILNNYNQSVLTKNQQLSDVNKEKFQMLQSVNQTNSKIKKMIENAKNEFLIIGAEKDFLKFYHSNFLECVDDKVKMKFLTSVSDKMLYIFDDIDRSKVKMMPSEIHDNLCFLIKDNDEIIFFIKNATQTTEQMTAVWTDSEALVYSMKLLFDSLWLRSKNIHL